MYKEIYPTQHTGAPLRAVDQKDWFGQKGDESRLVRCRFCGWICDPDREMEIKDGSFAGKGVSFGTKQTTSTYYVGSGRKAVTDTYYEPKISGGCPACGCFKWRS